jgi:hypothetical protein
VKGSVRCPKCEEIHQRQPTRQHPLAEVARRQQTLEHAQLALAVLELRLQRIEVSHQLGHLRRSAGRFGAFGATRRWRLVEIKLAAVEARQFGKPATERIKTDQVRVERPDALGERVHLAIQLTTRPVDLPLLSLEGSYDFVALG